MILLSYEHDKVQKIKEVKYRVEDKIKNLQDVSAHAGFIWSSYLI
jgi:hypothetical protein